MNVEFDKNFVAELREMFARFGFYNVTDDELRIVIKRVADEVLKGRAMYTAALRNLRSRGDYDATR